MIDWSWDYSMTANEVAMLLSLSMADDGMLGYEQGAASDHVRAAAAGIVDSAQHRDCHILAGIGESGVVGMCVVEPEKNPTSAHIAYVKKAFITPKCRGRHSVWAMADAVGHKVLELGCDRLVIDVRGGQHATRVWTAMGFSTFGVLDDYSRYNGHSWSGQFMTVRAVDLLDRVSEHDRRGGGGAS